MRKKLVWWTALPLALAPAVAKSQVPPPAEASTPLTIGPLDLEEGEFVEFSASQVTYDSQADIVTASGSVRLQRERDRRKFRGR